MSQLASIVLAAGQGKRMKSSVPKPLHALCGQSMLGHALAALRPLGPQPQVVIIGVGADLVRESVTDDDVVWAVQEEQHGTGHAAACAREALAGRTGDVLVTCGDIPLARTETWERVLAEHRAQEADATLVTALFADPTGYGRVLRDEQGLVQRIVEEADCDEATRAIPEGNVSLYCFKLPLLFEALDQLQPTNVQGEYYLTDVVEVLVSAGRKVIAVVADAEEVMGINDRAQLARATAIMRARINRQVMLEGATLIDPERTYIDAGVTVGRDTVIHPGAVLTGATTVGEGCVIGDNVLLEDSRVGDGSIVRHGSAVRESVVGRHCQIGPLAHLRDHSRVGDGSRVGGGEVVRSTLGANVNDLHFSYLGDATVGDGVNIGAGVITCNYDGREKHPTVIEAGAFVGSDAVLIAPVRLGAGSYVAAGSVVTHDVPAEAMAIARARQENKEEWAKRLPRKS
ncbi:MAG TPA: bifunctional UDP-N-acetylglucosamine diphosphorylase/glucosamine-1-phosphate N-acetyltransferase GlmU [Armatimonadota bacterium]